MAVTTTQFIAAVKRLIVAPSNQSLYDSDAIMATGDRKTLDTILPVVDSLNGEYYVTNALQATTSGTASYRLPTRALARKLRAVKFENSSGIRFPAPQISLERENLYQIQGLPFGFYFQGDRFTLVPTPNTTEFSIRYWYFLPPNAMCAVSSAAQVTGVSGDDVTVSAVPTAFAVGSVLDFIQGTAGYGCLAIDKTVTAIVGTTISFATDDVPTDLAVGDWLSIAQTTPILQMPDVCVPYLTTITAMDILQAMSDFEGYDRLNMIAHGSPDGRNPGQLSLMEKILQPRIEGEQVKIINDYGLVRRRAGGAWRGYYQF